MATYDINITVTDGNSLSYTTGFTININNVNEEPTNITLRTIIATYM